MDTKEQYKETRKELSLSQDQLAALLGCTRETISNRERGLTPITAEAWLALAMLSINSPKVEHKCVNNACNCE